jgi:hypothetical protein
MVSPTSRSLFQDDSSTQVSLPSYLLTPPARTISTSSMTPVTPCKVVGDEEKLDELLQVLISRRQPVLLINHQTNKCFMADPLQVLRWRQQKRHSSSATKPSPESSKHFLSPVLSEKTVSLFEPPTPKFCSTKVNQ